MASVKRFVEERLKLKVNMQKSAVDRPWKRKFLGFSFTFNREPKIRLAPKTKKRFMDKIRELTSRRKNQPMSERIKKLNTYLVGWVGYFKLADTKSVLQSLEKWIHRRLRTSFVPQHEPPYTERYVRWCERTEVNHLLLLYYQNKRRS